MKLSFSTLACPDCTFPCIVAIASNAGYAGVELRFVEGEDSLWKLPAFQGRNLADNKRLLADHGLKISCVDTSCRFHSADSKERASWVAEGERMADLAANSKPQGSESSAIPFSPVPIVSRLEVGLPKAFENWQRPAVPRGLKPGWRVTAISLRRRRPRPS